MKPKGQKSFMTLSQKECLTVSSKLFKNSESLYNSAILLASNGSYGHATSMLIHSTEETMKGFILFLDGNGFQFRNKVRGINSLFTNHSLRYGLAMLLSILHIFSEDVKKIVVFGRNNPDIFGDINSNREFLEAKAFEYFKEKVQIILKEAVWFSKAEFLRQDGFYVDYVDDIKTPLNINENDYLSVLSRVNNMHSIATSIIKSFESNDDSFLESMEGIKKQFKDQWYGIFQSMVEKYKDRNTNPLESLSKFLIEMSEELTDLKSFKEF